MNTTNYPISCAVCKFIGATSLEVERVEFDEALTCMTYVGKHSRADSAPYIANMIGVTAADIRWPSCVDGTSGATGFQLSAEGPDTGMLTSGLLVAGGHVYAPNGSRLCIVPQADSHPGTLVFGPQNGSRSGALVFGSTHSDHQHHHHQTNHGFRSPPPRAPKQEPSVRPDTAARSGGSVIITAASVRPNTVGRSGGSALITAAGICNTSMPDGRRLSIVEGLSCFPIDFQTGRGISRSVTRINDFACRVVPSLENTTVYKFSGCPVTLDNLTLHSSDDGEITLDNVVVAVSSGRLDVETADTHIRF